MMSVIKNTDRSVPKQITTPIGIQRRSPLIIIGKTPSAVVHDVKKIGLIRRFPASCAASFTFIPFWKRSSSAYSNMIIPLRTIIPTKDISPNTAVMEKSNLNIHSPKNAPKRHSVLRTIVSMAKDIFLKWNNKNMNSMNTAAKKVITISGPIDRLMLLRPPNSTLIPSGRSILLRYSFMAFVAVGWLLPYFMSAPIHITWFPFILEIISGSHSGLSFATCLIGTDIPGVEVETRVFPICS